MHMHLVMVLLGGFLASIGWVYMLWKCPYSKIYKYLVFVVIVVSWVPMRTNLPRDGLVGLSGVVAMELHKGKS